MLRRNRVRSIPLCQKSCRPCQDRRSASPESSPLLPISGPSIDPLIRWKNDCMPACKCAICHREELRHAAKCGCVSHSNLLDCGPRTNRDAGPGLAVIPTCSQDPSTHAHATHFNGSILNHDHSTKWGHSHMRNDCMPMR